MHSLFVLRFRDFLFCCVHFSSRAVARTLRLGRFIVLIMLYCVGCEDFNDALVSERKPVAPPGIASAEDVSDVQQVAAGGTIPSANNSTKQSSEAPPNPSKPTSSTQTKRKQSIIGKMTAEVVDAKEARKNPKIVVVENKISGSDPLTIAATAYVSMSSRISALNFKNQLNIIKATNGRYPTFEEYQKLAQQMRIEFTRLPPYQMYGYDSDTGGLLVLEDKAEKIRRYKQAGIPINEADKKYE